MLATTTPSLILSTDVLIKFSHFTILLPKINKATSHYCFTTRVLEEYRSQRSCYIHTYGQKDVWNCSSLYPRPHLLAGGGDKKPVVCRWLLKAILLTCCETFCLKAETRHWTLKTKMLKKHIETFETETTSLLNEVQITTCPVYTLCSEKNTHSCFWL